MFTIPGGFHCTKTAFLYPLSERSSFLHLHFLSPSVPFIYSLSISLSLISFMPIMLCYAHLILCSLLIYFLFFQGLFTPVCCHSGHAAKYPRHYKYIQLPPSTSTPLRFAFSTLIRYGTILPTVTLLPCTFVAHGQTPGAMVGRGPVSSPEVVLTAIGGNLMAVSPPSPRPRWQGGRSHLRRTDWRVGYTSCSSL